MKIRSVVASTAAFLCAGLLVSAAARQQPAQDPAPLPAQQPAEPQAGAQPPTFRSGVELVSVDVSVIDRQGQPLRGLGPGDFTVTVAGQPRRIVSAEYVDIAAAQSRA